MKKEKIVKTIERFDSTVEKVFKGNRVLVVSSKQIAIDIGVRHQYIINIINKTLGKLTGDIDKFNSNTVLSLDELSLKQEFIIFDSNYKNNGREYKCYYMNDIAYNVIFNVMQSNIKNLNVLYFNAIVKNEDINMWDKLEFVFNKNDAMTPELSIVLKTAKQQYNELNDKNRYIDELESRISIIENELQEALPLSVILKLVNRTRLFYPNDLEVILGLDKYKLYKFMRGCKIIHVDSKKPTDNSINNGLSLWDNNLYEPILTVDGLIKLMNYISNIIYQQHINVLNSL